jgi:hypothetical protein
MNKPTCCLDKKIRIDFMKKKKDDLCQINQIISLYGNPTNNLRHFEWQGNVCPLTILHPDVG